MEHDSNDSNSRHEEEEKTRVDGEEEEERSVEQTNDDQEATAATAASPSAAESETEDKEETEEREEVADGEEVEETAEHEEEEEDGEKAAVEDQEEEGEKDSDDEEFAGFEEEEISSKAKKRQIVSDSDEASDAEEKEAERPVSADNSDNEEVADEDEEDRKRSKKKKKQKKHHGHDEDNENQDSNGAVGHTDLEKALAKQKADNRKRNRKKNMDSEEITDVENTVAAIITEMKNVAMDDRIANEKSTPAIQKLKLLPTVVDFLKKSDYHATMIEMGILGAIAEWMAPLPDKSLPNIKIREEMIDALKDFGEINADYLKSSGVGKAVMFLYKHPKEIKTNKQKLEKLIHNWSRPIFNVDSNFKHLTKEERMQRDMEHVKTLNRRNSDETGEKIRTDDFLNESHKSKRQSRQHREEKSDSEDPNKLLRPGDPGFVPRARVPVPSTKDYIIRPKSNVDSMEIAQKAKKSESRIDKHTKKFLEIKKSGRFQRAVTMKIGGKD